MRTNPFIYRNLTQEQANQLMAWCDRNNVEYDIWDFNFEEGNKYLEIGLKDWAVYDNDHLD